MIRRGIGVQPYTVGSSFIGLLDTYTDAAAAYSVRKLRAAYTGSAIRVRRSSDNTEQDIGFDGNGNLDESALTTFVGANNGFVTTWYDQSGNSRNATQSTAANQPQIVVSGTIEKQNSKPILKFDGSNDFLIASNYTLTTNTFFATIKTINNGNVKTVFGKASQTDNTTAKRECFNYIYLNNYDLQISDNNNYPTATKTFTSTNFVLLSALTTGATGTMTNYVNGSAGTSATSVNSNLTGTIATSIGAIYQSAVISFFMNGTIGEIVIYNTNKSSNRTEIENNINTYYSIY